MSAEKPTAAARVLLVGDFPPPHGGVAVHVELLQRAIRAHGGVAEVLDIGKGQVPADGVHPAGGYATFASQLASFAARGYRIHLHTSCANPKSMLLTAICGAAGAVSGVPPYLTIHSGLMPAWIGEKRARQTVLRTALRAYGLVVAVSDEIRGTVLAAGVPAAQVKVLPAFSTAFLEPGKAPPAFAALRAEEGPIVCAMLAPGEVYGRDPLLTAFGELSRTLPSARLVVFGPGTDAPGFSALAALHAGPDAAARVHGLGELSRPAALAVMAGCDSFVRPTLADGDSVSVREALALGKRVVATSVGTRPAGVHLVAPGDARALATALGAALRAPAQAATPEDSDLLRILLPCYGLALTANAPGKAA